jgi:hypothetical protein
MPPLAPPVSLILGAFPTVESSTRAPHAVQVSNVLKIVNPIRCMAAPAFQRWYEVYTAFWQLAPAQRLRAFAEGSPRGVCPRAAVPPKFAIGA